MDRRQFSKCFGYFPSVVPMASLWIYAIQFNYIPSNNFNVGHGCAGIVAGTTSSTGRIAVTGIAAIGTRGEFGFSSITIRITSGRVQQ